MDPLEIILERLECIQNLGREWLGSRAFVPIGQCLHRRAAVDGAVARPPATECLVLAAELHDAADQEPFPACSNEFSGESMTQKKCSVRQQSVCLWRGRSRREVFKDCMIN